MFYPFIRDQLQLFIQRGDDPQGLVRKQEFTRMRFKSEQYTFSIHLPGMICYFLRMALCPLCTPSNVPMVITAFLKSGTC